MAHASVGVDTNRGEKFGKCTNTLFDLKTNLGWNRDLAKYLKTKNEFINKIKGKKAWIHLFAYSAL